MSATDTDRVDHAKVRRDTGLSLRATRLLGGTLTVGLHHVDHSGLPFRRDVNPFTYSLLAYPVLLLGLGRLFWPRWVVLVTGA